MEALVFFVYSLIVFFLLLLLFAATINYYFNKKWEYEVHKLEVLGAAISESKNAKKP